MKYLVLLIPIFPAIAVIINGLAAKYVQDKAGHIASGAMIFSFILSFVTLISVLLQLSLIHI